jgi:hypothetical protein
MNRSAKRFDPPGTVARTLLIVAALAICGAPLIPTPGHLLISRELSNSFGKSSCLRLAPQSVTLVTLPPIIAVCTAYTSIMVGCVTCVTA